MRELVGFACDQCKRKNYTIDKEPEDNHGETISQEVLCFLPGPYPASRG